MVLKKGILSVIFKSTLRWNLLLLYIILILSTLYTSYRLFYPYQILTVSSKTNHSTHETFNNLNKKNVSLGVYDITQPIKENFKCIITRTVPSTTVCLYSQWHDKYISHDLEDTGMWEPQVADDFLEVLQRDKDAGVFDIGANIGYYTLLAAKMGHKVVAVEPLTENIRRLHQAAQLGDLCHYITVLQNAVADVRISGTVRRSGDNQGDTRIELGVEPCQGSCPPTVKTILLDDLIEVSTFSRAVMKVDVQGYEHRAFQHAEILFSQIKITYIFMEWLVMKEYYASDDHDHINIILVNDLLNFFFHWNYRPYSLSRDGGLALDPKQWPKWPDDIVWHLLPDLDIKSKLLYKHYYNWPP